MNIAKNPDLPHIPVAPELLYSQIAQYYVYNKTKGFHRRLRKLKLDKCLYRECIM